jgi:hypothetical protein
VDVTALDLKLRTCYRHADITSDAVRYKIR